MKLINGGQSALIHMPYHTMRNRSSWLSIAAFCDTFPSRDLTQHARAVGRAAAQAQRSEGAPLAGEGSGREARLSPLPDGNHGDNDFCHRQPASGEAQ